MGSTGGGWYEVEFHWRLDPDIAHTVELDFNSEFWLNIGDDHNIVCGMSPGAPIDGDHALVGSIQLIFLEPVPPTLVYFEPYHDWPSIPGQMAYTELPDVDHIYVMVPYSEDFLHANAVFGFNSQAVATEGATWSTVKALFN